MNKIREYYSQVHLELTQKTTWPTWAELQSSAIIVMVASLIIALAVATMDGVFSSLMSLIYGVVNS